MGGKTNQFLGAWRIVEMELWDQEFVDMDVPGHFTFKKDGLGHFQFGLVQGGMDYRIVHRDNQARVEFSWVGQDSLG